MLRDGSFEGSREWGAVEAGGGLRAPGRRREHCADDSGCEEIHRRLRRIAKARAALDLEEAAALRDAEAACIWRRYGYASLIEYMEAELGHTPRAASERLRVAKAIVELPMIGDAMGSGELSFSAARELTRVATAETEGEWLEAARDLNVRQLEHVVAGHKRGNRPSDRPDPTLRRRPQLFDMSPETEALYGQALQILDEERGERHDRDGFMAAVCRMVIDHAAGVRPHGVRADENEDEDDDGEHACRSKAPYQIAVTVCRECKRGWQDGGGITVEMSPARLAVARCDAEEIGSVDGDEPERAKQAIPPAVRRMVSRRDHGRCRVTGCRSSRNLDVHHIVHREDGGTNAPDNLMLMCEGHHRAHHEGSLAITRQPPDLVFTKRANGVLATTVPAATDVFSKRASNAFTIVSRVVETEKALTTLGYKKHEAKAAAEHTRTHVGTEDWPIEAWIRYALSKCPSSQSSSVSASQPASAVHRIGRIGRVRVDPQSGRRAVVARGQTHAGRT